MTEKHQNIQNFSLTEAESKNDNKCLPVLMMCVCVPVQRAVCECRQVVASPFFNGVT